MVPAFQFLPLELILSCCLMDMLLLLLFYKTRLGGVVVERSLRMWEVPVRVIPKTLKMVVMTALLSALGCGV